MGLLYLFTHNNPCDDMSAIKVFSKPTEQKRYASCADTAMRYLKDLSGFDVSDETFAASAELWNVDLSGFDCLKGDQKTAARASAIANEVGSYMCTRADANYAEYKLIPDADEKAMWVNKRLINSARDELTPEMKAFLEEHGLEAPVKSSELSAEEMKGYLADREMETPVASLLKKFAPIRKQLEAEGMTWWKAFTHKEGTAANKAAQEQISEDDVMKGPIKGDSRPLTAWASEQILSPPDDVGQLAVASGHSTGLRPNEASSDEYIVTKHSEFGICISGLGKKRAGSSSSSSSSSSDSESSEITGYEFTKGKLQTADGRYIVVCLSPADNVIAALTKLRELSRAMSRSNYYKRVRTTMDTLDALAPIRDNWHFTKGFALHAMRSTYVDALHHKLGSLGLWPEGALKAEFTKKFLHHDDLGSSTAYGRMQHVESDDETPTESDEETPTESEQETSTDVVEVPEVAEATAAAEPAAAEVAEPAAAGVAEPVAAEVAVASGGATYKRSAFANTVDIDHDIALAELNVELHKGIVELHKGIVAVTRSEIALLVLRKRKRDAN
jgi:hypothetical protein